MDSISFELDKCIGKIGSEVSNIKRPQGLAIDTINENIYIVDEGNRKVLVYTIGGEFILEFPKKLGYILRGACGIAVKFNKVFVTEEFRSTISVFSLEGNFLTRFDGRTLFIKESLDVPTGITVAKDGTVFACDCFNSNIVIFTEELIPQIYILPAGKLPKDVKLLNDRTLAILNGDTKCIMLINLEDGNKEDMIVNRKEGDVYNPIFFEIYLNEYILISDYENNTIKIFSKKGKLLNVIGKSGEMFNYPTGIAVHSNTQTLISVCRKEHSPIQFFKLET
ncbi:E3 ubiquitin-protein ligase TRIM71-like [Oopsacas minuta]|uniref:E3 ubiquitin-protein ligase TRIM71-like n=1 Tax=Oopsacas minuta TaxID=111878 RepID=A0AAV7JTV3_9METZ|nr:E3 ubiquitin-protein ligase TRIM71-like [Oopsacas minuta]